MNEVICRIYEIESAAIEIMDQTAQKKKKLAEEAQLQKSAFDTKIATDTEEKLNQIRMKMEQHIQQENEKLLMSKNAIISELDSLYVEKHENYADNILRALLKG